MDDKQHINKQPTSAVEDGGDTDSEVAGNVREQGQDPSPDDRDRGEGSDADPAGGEEASRR